MLVIHANHPDQALHDALLLLSSDHVKEDSRNGPVLRFDTPVTTVWEPGFNCVSRDVNRDANPFLHYIESFWMLAGRNDVALVAKLAANMQNYSDDDRLVQAYRVGAIAGIAIKDPLSYPQEVYADRGHLNTTAIVDFVCPTESTLDAFCQMAYWHAVPTISITVILMDTITPDQCRFSDTAKLFDPLTRNKVHVTRWETPDLLKMKMTELARQLGYLEGGKKYLEKSIITV